MMLAVLSSCQDNEGSPGDTNGSGDLPSSGTVSENDTPAGGVDYSLRENTPDSLPAGLNFTGETNTAPER
jgi:hypothetical protein